MTEKREGRSFVKHPDTGILVPVDTRRKTEGPEAYDNARLNAKDAIREACDEALAPLTEQQMRESPLTLADLKLTVRSAHAFWKMPLRCSLHDAGLDVVAFSNGTLETHCRECKMLLGVLKLDKGTP